MDCSTSCVLVISCFKLLHHCFSSNSWFALCCRRLTPRPRLSRGVMREQCGFFYLFFQPECFNILNSGGVHSHFNQARHTYRHRDCRWKISRTGYIICATGKEWKILASLDWSCSLWISGFDTSFKLDFEIIGRGEINLNDYYTPHPKTYLGVAVDGFPNSSRL